MRNGKKFDDPTTITGGPWAGRVHVLYPSGDWVNGTWNLGSERYGRFEMVRTTQLAATAAGSSASAGTVAVGAETQSKARPPNKKKKARRAKVRSYMSG